MEAERGDLRRAGPVPERAAVILGNDALIAARPSTPAQLASACVLAGFDIIVPPSAGDEIVAAAYLDRFAGCSEPVIVACACPRVRQHVRALQTTAPPCVTVASPPVAAARYLRATQGDHLLITYVGDCPGAEDPLIDARFSPAGFLASLHRQGIVLEDQPKADRHGIAWGRYQSTPGGLPARRFIARPPIDRVVRELAADRLDLEVPLQRSPVILDLTDVACVCSALRDEVMELEPLRAAAPLFAIPAGLDTSSAESMPRSRASLRAREGLTTDPAGPTPTGGHETKDSAPAPQPIPATAPLMPPNDKPPSVHTPPRTVRTFTPPPRREASAEVKAGGRRSPGLLILIVAVLAGATALGVAAYATGARTRSGSSGRDSTISSTGATHADTIAGTLKDSVTRPGDTTSTAFSDSATQSDTSSASLQADSARAVRDSAARRRPRRARPPEIMPGWLPQGQPTWAPDSQAGRRPDSVPTAPPVRRPPA